jgi:outer membrane protein assembly factor BamB
MGKKNEIFNKKKAIASTFFIVLMVAGSLAALPVANAHSPPWNIKTYAFISVAPDTIGVGQTAIVVCWLNWPPPTAAGAGGDRWRNLTVDVTKPDGRKLTLGPLVSDPVGSSYTQFTPDQVGKYTLVFNFPGQTAMLNGPTGVPGTNSAYINDTFSSSSATTTLTVQTESILQPPYYPLPTTYWSRPIDSQNTEMSRLASNWLGTPQIYNKLQPDGAGPASAHVMWAKPISFGGIAGGQYATNIAMTYYSGTAYEGKFGSPLIIYGRLYYNIPRSDSPTGNGYVCVDLQTGEQIYWQNMTMPAFGQIFDYESINQHGIIPNGFLWRTVTDARNGGTVWMAYDPMDGNWLFNETNVPSGTQVYGPNGEILIYQMNATGHWLACWNNTAAHDLTASTDPNDWTSSNYFQWRPVGKNANASAAYSWNVTIPDLPGSAAPAIFRVLQDDVMVGTSTTLGGLAGTSTPDPYTIWAISLKPQTRGQLMWLKNYPAPPNNLTRSIAQVDPVSRVIVINEKETLCYYGINLDTGTQIWGPTPREADFNYYADVGLPRNNIAYGRLYSVGYGGNCYCYDLKNGSLLWTYSASAGFATPYGRYPIAVGAIADGKVYLFTTEHSANSPLIEGTKLRCVDAYTGIEVWSIFSYGSQNSVAVADGYAIFINLYDMRIYSVGKGPSATTVSAPQTAVPRGTPVLITGTVTDQTPAIKGTPALSDAAMPVWMQYLYMQKPMPENATGVNVTLKVVDPNGNSQTVGNAKSDIGGTYAFAWTPPVEGTYHVIATFGGTASYGSSYASTSFLVGPPAAQAIPAQTPTAAPTPTVQPTAPPTTTPTQATTPLPSQVLQPTSPAPTTTYIALGVVVTIIVAVAAALVLRKRK